MKYCPKCDTNKNELEFYNNRSTNDSLDCYCKACRKEQVAAYQKTDKGKAVTARAQRRYIDTSQGRTKKQELERRWRQTEKGRISTNEKALRRYYSDPEHYRLKVKARRHGVPLGVLKQVLQRDKVCQLCHTDKNLQFDHVYPVSLGGKGSLKNLQLLCDRCNSFKSNNLFLPDGNGGMMLTGKQHVINKK